MKRVGFIDYYLDEWHANNYVKWLRDNIARSNRGITLSYAWADIDLPGKISNDEWCKKNDITRLRSIAELTEKSDYIIVLAPDNPEQHLRLSEIPLKSGKPVFIDKTFADSYETAAKLIKTANEYSTPLLSSSALRFADEYTSFSKIEPGSISWLTITGPGNLQNYITHLIEILVRFMGTGKLKIKCFSSDKAFLFIIVYNDEANAIIHLNDKIPYQLYIQNKNEESFFINTFTSIFENLIDKILDFFESGISPVPLIETLEIVKIIDAAKKAVDCPDCWIQL